MKEKNNDNSIKLISLPICHHVSCGLFKEKASQDDFTMSLYFHIHHFLTKEKTRNLILLTILINLKKSTGTIAKSSKHKRGKESRNDVGGVGENPIQKPMNS